MLLFIGILFFSLGLVILLFVKKARSRGVIPLILGGVVIYLCAWGPLRNSKQKIREVISLKSSSVKSISFSRSTSSEFADIRTFNRYITFEDKPTIDLICKSLNKAHSSGLYVKNPGWVCRMEIVNTNDQKKVIGVRKAGHYIMLELQSHGESGWVYGYIEADSLSPVLDALGITP